MILRTNGSLNIFPHLTFPDAPNSEAPKLSHPLDLDPFDSEFELQGLHTSNPTWLSEGPSEWDFATSATQQERTMDKLLKHVG